MEKGCKTGTFIAVKLIFAILILAVGLVSSALFVRPITKINYVFTDQRIVFDTLRPVAPEIIMIFITAVSLALSAVLAVILIADLIRRKDMLYTISRAAVCLLADILCIAALIFGGLLYCYSDYDSFFDDFYPEYYVFEHEERRIVVAEGTFMFCGRSKIYQVYDDNTAWEIGSFDTDDAYSNCGHYILNWSEKGIEITYRDGISDQVKTEFFQWVDI